MRTLLALILVAAQVYADDPPSIDKLVEQLGSPSFPTRERATKQLKERGVAALPALRKALESKDEEVRKRAETLIPAMEIDEALLPKRITLDKSETSANGIVQQISKQTGLKLDLQPGVKLAMSSPLVFSDTPFWEAIEQFSKATETSAGLRSTGNSHEQMIHLYLNKARSPFVNIRGPFRLEANWFHEDRDIDLTRVDISKDGERGHRLTLSVNLLAEPRITFLHISPAKVDEAMDSEGKSLLEPGAPSGPRTTLPNGRPAPAPQPAPGPAALPPNRSTFRGESLIASDIRLRRASETAKTAKIIKGTIPVKIILIRKPVVVSAKIMDAGGKSIKAGDESLLITQVMNQGGNNIEVSIQVPYDQRNGGTQREWHDRFHVEDDAGNKFQINGRGTSSNGREYTISMYFAPPFNKKDVGPPTKLIFEDWIVHEYAIPFEFRDVPLP
ncbi:MAG TPA: hypothetical protein VHR66_09350 [Gemmataceae bacterium]|jgi:hypothetical protein|nr:hypothetical protein [Gemmataceae bacterium]